MTETENTPSSEPEATPAPARRRRTSWPVRVVVVATGLALIGFIGSQAPILYAEYRALTRELDRTREAAAVGYVNISPMPSYAQKPADWFHHDGDHTMLWAGWFDGAHTWFRIARGDLTQEQVTATWGSDVVRAIDHPIVEKAGGDHWTKIYEGAQVAGLVHAGTPVVYPIDLLRKVEVVNEQVGEAPLLVLYSPNEADDRAITVFDATHSGKRITMGNSGYVLSGKSLLYDRGSRSLWVFREDALACIAGPKKGSSLQLVSRLRPVDWSRWRSDHPDSRLVVGADRSKGKPDL